MAREPKSYVLVRNDVLKLMRKRLFISALILPAVVVPAAAYLLDLWPSSMVRGPVTSTSEQNAKIKPTEAKSNGGDRQGAAAKIAPPVLDVARIDPKGASVFAGRAEPNSQVTVLADNKEIGTTKADKFGEWALVSEKPVPTRDSQITLKARRQKIAIASQPRRGKLFGLKIFPKQTEDSPPAIGRAERRLSANEKVARTKAGNRNTAKAVTSRLMEQMERLVETAKKEAERDTVSQQAAPFVKNDSEIAAPVKTERRANQFAAVPPSRGEARSETNHSESQTAISIGETRTSGGESKLAAAKEAAGPSATPDFIPVPIKFVFRETNFTPEGVKAAKLLLTYVKLKAFRSIILSGHADERGTEPFNFELSRRRLEAVSQYLKDGGFEGEVAVEPKGETEPFQGVDRRNYPSEELWQLDRRVELHIRQ